MLQMPPQRSRHRTRTQTGTIRRRATAAAGGPTAGSDTTAPDVVTPEVATEATLSTSGGMAEAIAAAVMRQLEQSGRLLPEPVVRPAGQASQAPVATPSTSSQHLAADASSDDSDAEDVDAVLSGLLGGELFTPLPTYNVVNRPLGASLPDALKSKIRRGEYVNLQLLASENDEEDEDDVFQQQHQRLTLEVKPIGHQDTLSLVRPSHSKGIKTIDQWVAAFTVYGAVLTERSPQLAPGLFKHMADITEMARRFGGLAWYRYDKAYRREMGANRLSYGQVNWDLRFRCLEQTSNKSGGYAFRGNTSRSPYVRSSKGFQKGQCFQFEQFGSCLRPACQFKHACAKCSGKHPTSRCTVRPARPQGVGRTGAMRPSNHNKQ